MKFLRSKYVNNPVVAAITLVAVSAVLAFLNTLNDPIFTPREAIVVRRISDFIASPVYLLSWLPDLPDSPPLVIGITVFSLTVLFIIGAWAAAIYAVRALYRRMKGLMLVEHPKAFHSGLYLIRTCLVSLAISWVVFIILKCVGDLSSGAVIVCMVCTITSIVVCIVALFFYVAFCLRVWRNPNPANWRLLAVGTVLLIAATGSALFSSL